MRESNEPGYLLKMQETPHQQLPILGEEHGEELEGEQRIDSCLKRLFQPSCQKLFQPQLSQSHSSHYANQKNKSYTDIHLTDIAKAELSIVRDIINHRLVVNGLHRRVVSLRECLDPKFRQVDIPFSKKEEAFITEWAAKLDVEYRTLMESVLDVKHDDPDAQLHLVNEDPLKNILLRPRSSDEAFLHEDDAVPWLVTATLPINSKEARP